MSDEPNLARQSTLQQVIGNAEKQLAGAATGPFSEEALAALQTHIDQYIAELTDESLKVARRNRSPDAVAEVHVHQASDYLVSHASGRLSRLLGFFGGLCLGGALSGLTSMMVSGSYPAAGVVITAVLFTAGAFMSGFYFARD